MSATKRNRNSDVNNKASGSKKRVRDENIENTFCDYDTDDISDFSDSSSSFSTNDASDIQSDSDDDNENIVTSEWANAGNERCPFQFIGDSGVKFTVDNKEQPMEYFEHFFDDEVIELIVEETNRFAKQYLDATLDALPAYSRMRQWHDTSVDEIKMFIGLLILQGVDSKCETAMYFSKRESISCPFYAKVISGRRFLLIMKCLHFADNNQINNTPGAVGRKLAKIKRLQDMLLGNFMRNYIPEKDISVDESLLGWKGRLSWVQYIPTKRKRFGMKYYELCESDSGYMWNFLVYTGKDTIYNEKYNDLQATAKIVFSLCDQLLHKGYCLYIDNFYTSPDLAKNLLERETDCIGTLRLNRKGVPAIIKDKKLKKGEVVAAFKNKIMVLKWKDKKDVTMLSTIHDNTIVDVVSRRGAANKKPKVIQDYNTHMGGVDLSDNLLSNYSTARNRMKKYYKKMFRHLLDISVLNAFIIYKKGGGQKTRLNFIIMLGENLISTYRPNVQKASSSGGRSNRLIEKPSRLIGRHFPENCPPSEKKTRPQRKCAQCQKNNKRKESSYWCSECNVGLCVTPCFKLWHTKQ